MSRRLARALPVLVVLALVAGCGAGGFGNKNPAELKNSITDYVALGDGFTAAPYVGKSTDKDCLRSAENYPALVAKALGISKVKDVSCTGATTRSLTNAFKSVTTKKKLPAQLDAVTADTDLITLGIGIEDRSLLTSMFKICLQLPCGSDIAAKPLLTQLDTLSSDLTAAVRTLQDKAPSAYIVLVGYPRIAPTGTGCSQIPNITASKLDAANLLMDKINGVIRSTAAQTGAAYVNISSLSTNHTTCSDDPWVSGQVTKKGKSRAYHPNAAEQEAVATAVAAQVQSR